MPRTNIATQVPVGPFPAGATVSAGALKVNFAAADAVNHNKSPFTGRDILLVQNTDTNPHTITITSAPDEHGRSEDIAAYSVPAGETHAFNFRGGGSGWKQTDGFLYYQADDVTVKFAVIAPAN